MSSQIQILANKIQIFVNICTFCTIKLYLFHLFFLIQCTHSNSNFFVSPSISLAPCTFLLILLSFYLSIANQYIWIFSLSGKTLLTHRNLHNFKPLKFTELKKSSKLKRVKKQTLYLVIVSLLFLQFTFAALIGRITK